MEVRALSPPCVSIFSFLSRVCLREMCVAPDRMLWCCIQRSARRPPTLWSQSTRMLNVCYHVMELRPGDWLSIMIACDMRRQAALLYDDMDDGHHYWYVRQLRTAFSGMLRDVSGLQTSLRPGYALVLRDMYELVVRFFCSSLDSVRHMDLALAVVPFVCRRSSTYCLDLASTHPTGTVWYRRPYPPPPRDKRAAKYQLWGLWIALAGHLMRGWSSPPPPPGPTYWMIQDVPAWDDCLNMHFLSRGRKKRRTSC